MLQDFRYPIQPSPSIAIFERTSAYIPEPNGADTFAIPAFLVEQAIRSDWEPNRAIVVFTGSGFGELSQDDRNRVWARWGVPVFENRVDSGGRIIAEECEAHEGLHLRAGVEWDGEKLHGRCACGLESPRIVEKSLIATYAL